MRGKIEADGSAASDGSSRGKTAFAAVLRAMLVMLGVGTHTLASLHKRDQQIQLSGSGPSASGEGASGMGFAVVSPLPKKLMWGNHMPR